MFDRLVCASGGNPRPDLIDKKDTLKALGLGRIGKFAEVEGTPQVRGMVEKVHHLVTVKEA